MKKLLFLIAFLGAFFSANAQLHDPYNDAKLGLIPNKNGDLEIGIVGYFEDVDTVKAYLPDTTQFPPAPDYNARNGHYYSPLPVLDYNNSAKNFHYSFDPAPVAPAPCQTVTAPVVYSIISGEEPPSPAPYQTVTAPVVYSIISGEEPPSPVSCQTVTAPVVYSIISEEELPSPVSCQTVTAPVVYSIISEEELPSPVSKPLIQGRIESLKSKNDSPVIKQAERNSYEFQMRVTVPKIKNAPVKKAGNATFMASIGDGYIFENHNGATTVRSYDSFYESVDGGTTILYYQGKMVSSTDTHSNQITVYDGRYPDGYFIYADWNTKPNSAQ